jgi:Protein of unknown function (DUF5672)
LLNLSELVRVFTHQPKHLAAVAVPIYKPELNEYEVAALSQCLKVFAEYPIVFFFPEKLDLSYYKHFCKDHQNTSWQMFDNAYFGSAEKSNVLMLSSLFYNCFLDYKYILIHHLDAFAFRNELEQWCSLNYDYIGSPWINPPWKPPDLAKMSWRRYLRWKMENREGLVGNGGFSLRKVKSFIFALMLLEKEAKNCTINEDIFFACQVPRKFPTFSIASFQIALLFSFEKEPGLCFELNNRQLPFGCHGWDTHYDSFWKEHIEI